MTRPTISTDSAQVAAVLRAMPGTVNAAVGLLTARYTQLLRTRVRARASGRPGPRRQTGDYRRGISGQTVQVAPGVWQGVVGTSSPQGRRLEYGFHGTDSLGRRFNQPPYPHFGPALDETAPQYQAALGALVAQVLNGERVPS